jgi:hypothetical protein
MTRGQDPVQRLFEVRGVIDKLPFRDAAVEQRASRKSRRRPPGSRERSGGQWIVP